MVRASVEAVLRAEIPVLVVCVWPLKLTLFR
jgi:hypothetical protein